tara:strand:- start:2595 stop:2921 length:327 start_codon:yes stop_codon:yes gene_type:complete
MRLLLVLSFVLFGLSSFAQDSWQTPKSAKDIKNPYVGNKIAAQKGQALYSKLCWTCHGKKERVMALLQQTLNLNQKIFRLLTYKNKLTENCFGSYQTEKESWCPTNTH